MSKKSTTAIAAKKSKKYVAAKVVDKTRFNSPDGAQQLTVVLSHSTKAFNVKASLKGTQENAPEAATGCRESFSTEVEARKAYDTLVTESKSRGWLTLHSRSSFSSIPAAPALKTNGSKK